MRIIKPWVWALATTFTIVGCANFNTSKHPEPILDLPSSTIPMTKINPEWWTLFNDPKLNALIQEALNHNQDLALANARIEEAQANYRQIEGSSIPQVNGGFNVSRGGGSAQTNPLNNATQTIYKGSVMLDWELDLWGKMSQNKQASLAKLESQVYTRDGARLSLTAQVAQAYFNILALEEKLAVTDRTIRTRYEAWNLHKKRFTLGLISELEARQAEIELSKVLLLKPDLESSLSRQKNALNILLGRSPLDAQQKNISLGGQLPEHSVVIPPHLSSELMLRRPDIAASEAQLRAAHAQIDVARSAYFPNISLTGNIGSSSLLLKNLFTSGTGLWNIAGGMIAPIFNWNQTSSQIDIASSKQKQALAQYTQTVQQAFSDVLTSLSQHEASTKTLRAYKLQAVALKRAVDLSKKRYEHGYVNHLEVLDAERNLLQAQMGLSDAKLAQLTSLIQVYKALGGGWEKQLTRAE